jgi:hypothetical protein
MLRTFSFVGGGMLAFVALFMMVGCSRSSPDLTSSKAKTEAGPIPPHSKPQATQGDATNALSDHDEDHGHKAGSHGGIIVSLGRDSYHVEAIITKTGELRLYTLGKDETRVIDIETQPLIAYVKAEGSSDSTELEIRPQPQPGDGEGKASLFVAQLPEDLTGTSIEVAVPNIAIGGERFRLGFTNKSDLHDSDARPEKISDEAESNLYLTPGGLYTQADIEANGNVTASKKFAAFHAAHDLKPKVGDKLCPVTLTKANPQCSWIVGGKKYEFCCPPCINEFVTLAKTKPEEVKDPGQYVKSDSDSARDQK